MSKKKPPWHEHFPQCDSICLFVTTIEIFSWRRNFIVRLKLTWLIKSLPFCNKLFQQILLWRDFHIRSFLSFSLYAPPDEHFPIMKYATITFFILFFFQSSKLHFLLFNYYLPCSFFARKPVHRKKSCGLFRKIVVRPQFGETFPINFGGTATFRLVT